MGVVKIYKSSNWCLYFIFNNSPVISKITGKGFNISEELNLEEFYTEVDSKAIYNSIR